MPSKLRAIAVRLPPHVFEVFARHAELQGRSRGAVVAEILEAIYEPLMRTVALLEAAQEAPKQVRDNLRGVLEDIERDLVKTAGGSMAQMDWLIGEFREGGKPAERERSEPAAASPARVRRRRSGGGGPPPSNHGGHGGVTGGAP